MDLTHGEHAFLSRLGNGAFAESARESQISARSLASRSGIPVRLPERAVVVEGDAEGRDFFDSLQLLLTMKACYMSQVPRRICVPRHVY